MNAVELFYTSTFGLAYIAYKQTYFIYLFQLGACKDPIRFWFRLYTSQELLGNAHLITIERQYMAAVSSIKTSNTYYNSKLYGYYININKYIKEKSHFLLRNKNLLSNGDDTQLNIEIYVIIRATNDYTNDILRKLFVSLQLPRFPFLDRVEGCWWRKWKSFLEINTQRPALCTKCELCWYQSRGVRGVTTQFHSTSEQIKQTFEMCPSA